MIKLTKYGCCCHDIAEDKDGEYYKVYMGSASGENKTSNGQVIHPIIIRSPKYIIISSTSKMGSGMPVLAIKYTR